MGSRPRARALAVRLVPASLVALALLAGTARARPWAKWAPAPLASDSSFAALSARPADSLGTDEYAWVDVQRDWRAQRAFEGAGSPPGITSIGQPHVPRPADARFARLASQPYSALSVSERSWLATESAAQRGERARTHGALGVVLFVAVIVAGASIAVWNIDRGLGHFGD